jgi:lysophospholipase L1-like esterase
MNAFRAGGGFAVGVIVATIAAAQPPSGASLGFPSAEERQRLQELSVADHRAMLQQLGIKKLRPGPNGRAKAGEANAANYDSTQANPFPDYPDPLTLRNGEKVTTPAMWWQRRRAEIVEDFEREVYGRVPTPTPQVTWRVTQTIESRVGDVPVVAKEIVGHVDNANFPAISVDLRMVLVTPAKVATPVPVLMMFGLPALPPPAEKGETASATREAFASPAPASTQQLIAAGWGYATISPASIQADNGAGLTRGIIGLVNRGERRRPEDWGALRAWAWGAARGLDYLETDPAVDARRVGIEGVSRYGKAALVTLAFEPRFATALVGSSGAGGAKPFRRNFGEAVENLAGAGEYHWMAGNFLKYAAAEATFGPQTANDLPVDSPELIALCAPRPVFISYGIPERGDAHWLDHQGSYMAAVAAGAVYRLLGAGDLGDRRDYREATMPPVNWGLLGGELAWRQHDGGHEDRSNMKYFLAWANAILGRAAVGAGASAAPPPADQPVARTDRNSMLAHEQLLQKARQGRIDVYFLGDSITRRWGATDYPDFLAHWTESFHGWNAANFGWGGDTTQNILWRLEHGELDAVNPKVIVLLAGTNNVGREPGNAAKASEIANGIRAIVGLCRRKAPRAVIVLTAIFPRNDNLAVMPMINRINEQLATLADGNNVRFLNLNDRLADQNGVLIPGLTVDQLHLSLKGYQLWADALKPILTELLGPPATTDHAPPPTGDPSVAVKPAAAR